MVKSIISSLMVCLMLFLFAYAENLLIQEKFTDFHKALDAIYQKIDDQTALYQDVYALQDNWIDKKKTLHVFIPHNEIKEFDLWIAETVTFVRDKQWGEAISKIEVLKELCEQIPRTFCLSLENIL